MVDAALVGALEVVVLEKGREVLADVGDIGVVVLVDLEVIVTEVVELVAVAR